MKVFRLIGILGLLVFSFYLTDFVTELAISSNPLYKTIKNNSDNYSSKYVNATIDNNTIIPGIKGKKINEVESFLNMKDFGEFNKNYLIYDFVKPEISLEDNKDKIIISGNKSLRNISLLVNNNDILLNYLKDNNIKYSKLVKLDDKLDNKENINIENEVSDFKKLNSQLNKKNLNKNICLLNYSNISECKRLGYYIVKHSYELSNSNMYNVINEFNNGDIILVDNNFSLENFKIFINKIKNKDLEIKYLSEFIKE